MVAPRRILKNWHSLVYFLTFSVVNSSLEYSIFTGGDIDIAVGSVGDVFLGNSRISRSPYICRWPVAAYTHFKCGGGVFYRLIFRDRNPVHVRPNPVLSTNLRQPIPKNFMMNIYQPVGNSPFTNYSDKSGSGTV